MKKQEQQIVPIVQQDLSHEETIVQIAFSLDALEKIVSNVFTNVECAIEQKKKRLSNIQNRCENAKKKVEKLSNFNKSIKVFSSYKYPGPIMDLFYRDPLFRPIEINEPDVQVKCSSLPPDKLSLKEKLKFYHVRDGTLKNVNEVSGLEGLGTLPNTCSNINSVLLYNTSQNLYKHYKIIDPLNVLKQVDLVKVNDDKTWFIEPDPISLGSSDPIGYKTIHNFSYSPTVQDVPDIEAPVNLPRLTGIADDLTYNPEQQQQQKRVECEIVESITEKKTEPCGLVNVELPVDEVSKVKVNNTDTASPTIQPPPDYPLPPPMPPPFTLLDDELNHHHQEQIKTETLVESNVRANLMEAIRQAGGKSKLKRVTNNENNSQSNTGKSLMDDLHEKLHMRRKGISGKLDNTDGILDRIVSMIPPPPVLSKQSQDDDNEDWDD